MRILKSTALTLALLLLVAPMQAAPADHTLDKQVRQKSADWMKAELKARQLTDAKNYKAAIAIYKDVLEQRSRLGLDLMTEGMALAELYEKAGDYKQADAMFKDTIAQREKSSGDESDTLTYPLQQYAQFLKRRGNKEAAAIEKRIAFIAAQQNKAPRELLALSKNPGEPAEDARKAVSIGRLYLERDQYARAMIAFNQAIKLNSKEASAWEGRGEAQNNLGNEDKARSDLDRAIALDAKNTRALFQRALYYAARENIKAALADLDQALRVSPDDTEMLSQKAKLLQDTSHQGQAAALYSKVLALDPDCESARCQRGLCYLDLKDARAAADFAYLAEQYPDDSNYKELQTRALKLSHNTNQK